MKINLDKIDVPAFRAAMKTKYRHDQTFDRMPDQQIITYAIGDRLSVSMHGLIVSEHFVVLQIEIDASLRRTEIMNLMGLKIVSQGQTFVFDRLAGDKEIVNYPYSDQHSAAAWMEFTFVRETQP